MSDQRSLRSHCAVNSIKVDPSYGWVAITPTMCMESRWGGVVVSGLLTWGWWYSRKEQLSSWHYKNCHFPLLLRSN